MFKEVKYIFKYDKGEVPAETAVHVFVDPVEGRRWWDQDDVVHGDKYIESARYPLNYKGTGVDDTQVIEAEMVHYEKIVRDGETLDNNHIVFYYLPDVDAYARAFYYYSNDPEYPPFISLQVTLLDKLPKDSTE